MENNRVNIPIRSNFIGKTSSWDKKTMFYGMMSDINHKTPNGYNCLHNPETKNVVDMEISFVDNGHIQHIFEDELFDNLKKEATEITILLFNNTHVFIDFNISNESTEKCRFGVAITMSSMYVGRFEYLDSGKGINFSGNHYDKEATVGYIDDDIDLVSFFIPYGIVYQRHDWDSNQDKSCIVKVKRPKSWFHFW